MLCQKKALNSRKISQEQWHCRLGHPSSLIVQQVLQFNQLLCSSTTTNNPVCNACQQAKSHQLPLSSSNSVSSSLLEFVFSDVWGPAQQSAGGFKYYVSFIDDFSKFTWIYLLKTKADILHTFLQFQKHVEHFLNKKIICMQTDWGRIS